VGRKLTVKADSSSVTIHDQTHEIVCYARGWERGQTFAAERFQKELYAQMAAAQRAAAQQRLVRLLVGILDGYGQLDAALQSNVVLFEERGERIAFETHGFAPCEHTTLSSVTLRVCPDLFNSWRYKKKKLKSVLAV
jgi:hypothetical protein